MKSRIIPMDTLNTDNDNSTSLPAPSFSTYDTLKRLTDAYGVAGNERHSSNPAASVSEAALVLLRGYDHNAVIDAHGSVVGRIGNDKDKPVILLDAHIDQVGLIVTFIDSDGFVKAESCGGIDRRVLAGQPVTIHSSVSDKPLRGTVCTLPPHVRKEEDKSVKADEIKIDLGLTAKQAEEVVALGDVVTVGSELSRLAGTKAAGAALDDRAGVVAILYALELLKNEELKLNIAVSFSVQEELGLRGAAITAYNAEPDYAIAVDVSYGLSPDCGSVKHKCGETGKGAMIGYAPSLEREMFERLKRVAEENRIPYQLEIMSGDTSGTNADSISTVKGGVKTALLSVPLRYMHTPVEVVDIADIEATGRLIAEFVRS
jgi:endoglucanase